MCTYMRSVFNGTPASEQHLRNAAFRDRRRRRGEGHVGRARAMAQRRRGAGSLARRGARAEQRQGGRADLGGARHLNHVHRMMCTYMRNVFNGTLLE